MQPIILEAQAGLELRETHGDFLADVFEELRQAERLHKPLNSLHEAELHRLRQLDHANQAPEVGSGACRREVGSSEYGGDR